MGNGTLGSNIEEVIIISVNTKNNVMHINQVELLYHT